MRSWHVVQEVIVKSKNEIVHVEDEIVTVRWDGAFIGRNIRQSGTSPKRRAFRDI